MLKAKILLDHVSREIDLACNIKKTLEELNIGELEIIHQDYCNTVTHYDFWEKTFDGKYDLIIVPSYNVVRTPEILLRTLVNRAKLVIYHSEQIYNDVYDEEKLNLSNLARYDKHISAHLVWGEFFAKKLINKAKINKDKVFIVGNYKLDFTQERKRLSKGRVLLASDYKVADLSNAELMSHKSEYKIELPEKINEKYSLARKKALGFISQAAEKFPNIEFILRPHPGENRDSYNNIVAGNIEVSPPGKTYSEDLLNSDLVLGFTSTSVIEVVCSGRQFLSLDFVDIDKGFLSQHAGLLNWVSAQEAMNAIELISKGQLLFPDVEQEVALNNLMKSYESVGSNIVNSLCFIASDSYKYKTTYSANDIYQMAFSLAMGICKILVIKLSNILNGKLGTNHIIDVSKKSLEVRVRDGEIVNQEVIDRFSKKASSYKPYSVVNKLSPFGWIFNEKA